MENEIRLLLNRFDVPAEMAGVSKTDRPRRAQITLIGQFRRYRISRFADGMRRGVSAVPIAALEVRELLDKQMGED